MDSAAQRFVVSKTTWEWVYEGGEDQSPSVIFTSKKGENEFGEKNVKTILLRTIFNLIIRIL